MARVGMLRRRSPTEPSFPSLAATEGQSRPSLMPSQTTEGFSMSCTAPSKLGASSRLATSDRGHVRFGRSQLSTSLGAIHPDHSTTTHGLLTSPSADHAVTSTTPQTGDELGEDEEEQRPPSLDHFVLVMRWSSGDQGENWRKAAAVPRMSTDFLRNAFEQFGPVQDVFVPGPRSREHEIRGYGIATISFAYRADAEKAISNLHGEDLYDRHGSCARISLEWALEGGRVWKYTPKEKVYDRFGTTAAERQSAMQRSASETIDGVVRDLGSSFNLSGARASRFKRQARCSGGRILSATLGVSKSTSREAVRAKSVKSLLQNTLVAEEAKEAKKGNEEPK